MNDIPLTPPVKTPLRCLPALCICLICLLAPTAWAQTELLFWHSHDATSDTIEAFAEVFNSSQSDYTIIPEYVGNFEEAGIRLLTAYGGGNHPVLFSAEMTVIPRLLEEGILVDLTHLTQDITEDDVADFVPMLWNYGLFDAKRYSLPFANSALVLFYNANLLEQKNVSPPTTWEEFEQVTSELSTRRIKAFINVNIPLAFEAMVATRGGNIIQDDLPNFNSPEAIAALEMLQRISRNRDAINRSMSEIDIALIDFIRTKGMMAFASLAMWPEGSQYSVAFEVGAAPIPMGELMEHRTPIAGAQLVVLQGASPAQQEGAYAFWQFLMEAENVATWVRDSYYLPTRFSALPHLEDWYAEDPTRAIALEQLDNLIGRPKMGAYTVWQGYLAEALDKALQGNMDARAALDEAQQRSLDYTP